ncbi:MAG: hypothetical protein JWQ49_6235 [Edaphobacter sp.]|nr:hypothetical protein [Edaphobacter sp.]
MEEEAVRARGGDFQGMGSTDPINLWSRISSEARNPWISLPLGQTGPRSAFGLGLSTSAACEGPRDYGRRYLLRFHLDRYTRASFVPN